MGSIYVVVGPDGQVSPSTRSSDENHCLATARQLSEDCRGTYAVRRVAVFNGVWKLDDMLVASFTGGRRTEAPDT